MPCRKVRLNPFRARRNDLRDRCSDKLPPPLAVVTPFASDGNHFPDLETRKITDDRQLLARRVVHSGRDRKTRLVAMKPHALNRKGDRLCHFHKNRIVPLTSSAG